MKDFIFFKHLRQANRELGSIHRDFSRRLFEKYRFIIAGSRLALFFLPRQYRHFYTHQTYNTSNYNIHQSLNTTMTNHIDILFQVNAPLLRDFLFREISLFMNLKRDPDLYMLKKPVTDIFNLHYHSHHQSLFRGSLLLHPYNNNFYPGYPGKTKHLILDRHQISMQPEFKGAARGLFAPGPGITPHSLKLQAQYQPHPQLQTGLKGPEQLHRPVQPHKKVVTGFQAQVYKGMPVEHKQAVSKHRVNTRFTPTFTRESFVGANLVFARVPIPGKSPAVIRSGFLPVHQTMNTLNAVNIQMQQRSSDLFHWIHSAGIWKSTAEALKDQSLGKTQIHPFCESLWLNRQWVEYFNGGFKKTFTSIKETELKSTHQVTQIFKHFREHFRERDSRDNNQKHQYQGLSLKIDTWTGNRFDKNELTRDQQIPGENFYPGKPTMIYHSPPTPPAPGPLPAPGPQGTFTQEHGKKSTGITSDIYRKQTETIETGVSMIMPGNKIHHLADRVYDLILERVRRERAMRG